MERRKEVEDFADAMEIVLSTHDKTKGDSWKDMSEDQLKTLLIQEVGEALQKDAIDKEFVDIANICMMIWSNRSPFD